MSQLGQTEKNSARAYVFRFALELGHCSIQSACLKRANNGTRGARRTGNAHCTVVIAGLPLTRHEGALRLLARKRNTAAHHPRFCSVRWTYSALMPAALMSGHHFSISDR